MEANKPVLLTVDDDPGVSRAVAPGTSAGATGRTTGSSAPSRDARRWRRCGRSSSAATSGGAAGRLPHAGDERPGVPGAGHGPVPARPAGLLTAYADTDAAIQAINVIDLSHYLLKPWDPPAEALPGGGRADRAVAHRRGRSRSPRPRSWAIAGRCAPTRCRTSLPRSSVSYRWLNADEPEGRGLLAAAGLDETSIPLVVTPEGESLVNPGVEELAARSTCRPRPTTSTTP